MIKEIHMPKLSSKSDQYFFGEWNKDIGDKISSGEVLFEVETDKVVSQVESQETGILKEQKVESGQTVTVGDLVALIEVSES
ncbi:biotin/lipoyl-containing protein [Liquorilactobacillus uvarum]|uniref:Lipoyl-binding domain-containing protein n=1 Tax=Liquorilactobacillus uvarum DSM 19971 TaxID=1423812 RepID=A0A0R1PUF2_9LACO|nr:biotin/lipoyl-containing protein [Liquorilactobacillus uvarum]KRL36030.1 hypothetical protein FD20_GL001459 [Liquorilactobacillus uvarum DSM 19971]